MTVRKEADGRRSVAAEVEVPGTPESVWRAIATGSGISSWFVPSRVEEHEGGTVVTSFGPGMDAVSTITRWDPPAGFTAESGEGPGAVATEWIVESRGGDTCVVRVVHRWFADDDTWDGEYEGHAYGWATSFFRMLWLYLSHFPGRPCAQFQLTAFTDAPSLATFRTIRDALGIDGTQPFASAPGTPELAGVPERTEITDPDLLRIRTTSPQVVAALEGMEGEEPELLLKLDRPAPGLAHIMVMRMGDQTMISMRLHFFGERAADVARDAEREWSDWLAARFPQPVSP